MYTTQFITVAIIHLLAVMSPGPDFLMVSRSALLYSRKLGLYSALGLAIGILFHVTYSLIGIGVLIANSVLLFSIVKYLGAAYLVYIGYKSLRARKADTTEIDDKTKQRSLSRMQAVRLGFFTNVLNPKASLFFLAIFSQVINPATPILIQVAYGLEMAVVTFMWFGVVAVVLSYHKIRLRFAAVQHRVERVFGVLLIALGVKVAVS